MARDNGEREEVHIGHGPRIRVETAWVVALGAIVGMALIAGLVVFFTTPTAEPTLTPLSTPTPTPSPAPTLTALAEIDRILEGLELGNIAFNAPTALGLRDLVVIQLLLSAQKSIEELQAIIAAAGEKEGARIRVSNQMEARLSGAGFKIEAITPEIQAVSGAVITEWKWEIEPTKPGLQRLHLTLSVLMSVDGDRTRRAIRTFEQIIDVRITWQQRLSSFGSNNWQWIWTVILIPIAAWILRKLRKRGQLPPP
jgi:hypothetical protein